MQIDAWTEDRRRRDEWMVTTTETKACSEMHGRQSHNGLVTMHRWSNSDWW